MTIPVHRNNDSRLCGASTIVVGQNTVFVNGELASIQDDPNSDGGGALTASNNDGTVWINGKLINLLGSASLPDDLCLPVGPPHCGPTATSGSPNVFACGGPKPTPSESTGGTGISLDDILNLGSGGGTGGSGGTGGGSGGTGGGSGGGQIPPRVPTSQSDIVEIIETGPGYNIVKLADGTIIRQEGTRAWRNNNPGNIRYGSYAISQGAIGSDGAFAIFPSYEIGRQAKENLLFDTNSYKNLSINDAINRYAPPSENSTNVYINNITSALGVPSSTSLSSLTPEQRTTMLNVMERVEGFVPGKVTINGGN